MKAKHSFQQRKLRETAMVWERSSAGHISDGLILISVLQKELQKLNTERPNLSGCRLII